MLSTFLSCSLESREDVVEEDDFLFSAMTKYLTIYPPFYPVAQNSKKIFSYFLCYQ